MTTEKDTSKPGWKAHTVVALISLAVGIIFLTGGTTISLIAGTSLLGLAVYHYVVALRLRRELKTPAEEEG
ncbi:hypothetical protein ACH49M_25095 [Rhodococcus qingshengii]|jgi:uncharacterized membrane protein HdeD (DUF308 family)|uniref:hypothetical protein n=1 Tax=Actinomycetes TaxID=1760 RepID=UPI0006D10010|nr:MULTISPECIES: hypothetical protein [Rhodococcus]NHE64250.1 hypothetical protein [Rhodococcus sp. D-46]ARE31937.1 hypothetical protein A0W34_00200 [Rhodococcus sp. BH4]KZL32505.1 hypothetical protein A3852_08895 [Rhodococcus qingshengii]MBQ9052145.1 hypothetical protein [Rhodococcus sp. (in: high G+C Gram-positive bacteria)]MBW0294628.1 hypothetical protein [Rhodococcus sp. MH15]